MATDKSDLNISIFSMGRRRGKGNISFCELNLTKGGKHHAPRDVLFTDSLCAAVAYIGLLASLGQLKVQNYYAREKKVAK